MRRSCSSTHLRISRGPNTTIPCSSRLSPCSLIANLLEPRQRCLIVRKRFGVVSTGGTSDSAMFSCFPRPESWRDGSFFFAGSLHPERPHWLDISCALCRDHGSQECGQAQNDSRGHQHSRIGGTDIVELACHEPSRKDGRGDANRQADAGLEKGTAQHHPQN